MRAILPLLVGIGFTCYINAQSPQTFDPVAKARATLEQLTKGQYAAVVATFDDKVKAGLPEDKLRATWVALQTQVGALRRTGEPRLTNKGDFHIVVIPGEFERSNLEFTFVYTPAGQVAGFNIRPAATTAANFVDAAYVDPSQFSEREVTVDAGGWPLPGTLTMPAGDGPLAGVVLVHGSGPGDRDQSLGSTKVFRDLARGLASRRVAVLRYDKRTRVHGAKAAALAEFTVKEEVIDDAVAAVHVLRAAAGVDPKRVFVAGHSLGGMLAPRIAAAAGGDIAGLIILAGAVRPIEELVLDQTRYLASADGEISADERTQIDAAAAVVERVKTLKPTDAPVTMAGAAIPASYLLDLRGYQPAATAAKLDLPMLILQGGRDYQVTGDDFARWKAALGERRDVKLTLYPTLNHLFIAGSGPSLPSEYLTAGHVAETVVQDIADWVYSSHR